MKQNLFTLAAVALLASSAHAQTSGRQNISAADDVTNVSQQVVQLKAQLAAVERETLRRLDCQTNTQLSTATGCREVPGLREHVAYMVAHPELQQ